MSSGRSSKTSHTSSSASKSSSSSGATPSSPSSSSLSISKRRDRSASNASRKTSSRRSASTGGSSGSRRREVEEVEHPQHVKFAQSRRQQVAPPTASSTPPPPRRAEQHATEATWYAEMQQLLRDMRIDDALADSFDALAPAFAPVSQHVPPLILGGVPGLTKAESTSQSKAAAAGASTRRFHGNTGRRVNMSFNNPRFLDIQRENQRLLRSIVKTRNTHPMLRRHSLTTRSSVHDAYCPGMMTPSQSMDRYFQQQSIYNENQDLLQRLRATSPAVETRWRPNDADQTAWHHGATVEDELDDF